jgi:CRP-like cAMP-binding protein
MQIPNFTQLVAVVRSLTDPPDEELAKFTALFQPLTLKRGSFFVQAGDDPKTFAFLNAGIVRAYYADDSGNEYTQTFCAENEFTADYSSLLLNQPAKMFIQALEETNSFVANYADYIAMAKDHPCWRQLERRIAENLFIKREQRGCSLLMDDATTRYLNFSQQYPQWEKRLKKRYVASYLGITPVALSRIRTQLRENPH